MLKSYQLMLSIVLLFACFNLGTESFSRNLNAHYHRPNATYGKPANNYQPWNTPRHNTTGPYFAQPYQGAVQQPNIGFHNNNIGSGTHYQQNSTYGFNAPAQPYYPSGPSYGNFNYTHGRPSNSSFPYGKLFKFL